MLPAEIWRRNAINITRLFIEKARITRISVDDDHQTADADFADNQFPPGIIASRLEIYKDDDEERNLMADMLVELRGEIPAKTGNDNGKKVPLAPVDNQ